MTTFLLLALGQAIGAAGPAEFELSNGHLRIEGHGSDLISLQVDPEGRGRYGRNWLVRMGFEGLRAGDGVRLAKGPAEVRVSGVEAARRERVEVKSGGLPDQLGAGHTLGQTITAEGGALVRVEAQLPTWESTTSDVTLRLRRDGPEGEVVAERRLEDVVDNAWQALDLDPQPAGRYYLEIAEPEGTVGWWSSREDTYAGGTAYLDGQPQEGRERAIRVHTERIVGRGEVVYRLDGSRLWLTAELRPTADAPLQRRPVAMRVRWDNTGYDVTAASVPFRRFYTDTQRYMPTEQLKRWGYRNGRYELSFNADRWIEADGTENHDLRFFGAQLALSWQLDGQETTLLLSPRPATTEGVWRSELTVEARPRDDHLPNDWPRFLLPDATAMIEANTFFYERAFTYPPVWGPAAWMEWNALTRCWQLGPHLAALRGSLETYPITDQGYVHTWGGQPGWPFPDPKKYDTRHFDTNARFILACRRYATWTGELDFLKRQAERIRRAMEYQLTVLHGADGLIIAASPDVTGRHQGVGDNYWDILPFGYLDAYANVVWYASLEAMAEIEAMLREGGGAPTEAPVRDPVWYRDLAERARRAYNETFWDEQVGRYIGCVDADGARHDYGFTFVNLEAMAYGLADDDQVDRIYGWMETGTSSTGEKDIYSAWVFAPRATTIHNPRWKPDQGKLEDVPGEPWWFFGWRGTPFGDQCQDGGAILYTSFYDLMARCRHRGPDDAWRRWEAILGRWRDPDHLCGGSPLYRGENPQQIPPGAVGTDIPFPESGMVPCWLLYGVLGLRATSQGLAIAPRLPASLPWAGIENLGYRGLRLSVRVTRREATVTCRDPGHEFEWRRPLEPGGEVLFVVPR